MILTGDCRALLRTLDADSAQTCVTSPPYWGLRDYGHTEQLGLEETPDAYVAAMVEVFREVRRVLRPDGTLWLNLGDSYVNNPSTSTIPRAEQGNGSGVFCLPAEEHVTARRQKANRATAMIQSGLKKKDLVGIPWRVAFALQADGWWLRSDIIWAKPNPMPESVTDRPTKAHEYVFLMSKAESYFYDAEPIREAPKPWNGGKIGDVPLCGPDRINGAREQEPRTYADVKGANARSVWPIASEPYDGAHFAVMPSVLVSRCILAGSRMGDTVLDPFLGSGTVGMVAEQLGRSWIGCELNPEFAKLAEQRTAQRGLFGGGQFSKAAGAAK